MKRLNAHLFVLSLIVFSLIPMGVLGQGTHNLEWGVEIGEEGDAMFNESEIKYTAKDIRFTVKGDILYAIVLDWPGDEVIIRSLVPIDEETEEEEGIEGSPGYYIYPDEIKSITMLGDGKELEWELIKGKGLKIRTPENKPCDHAFTFKIVRKHR